MRRRCFYNTERCISCSSYHKLSTHSARFSALLHHHFLLADGIAVADLLEEGAVRLGVITARHFSLVSLCLVAKRQSLERKEKLNIQDSICRCVIPAVRALALKCSERSVCVYTCMLFHRPTSILGIKAFMRTSAFSDLEKSNANYVIANTNLSVTLLL